MNKQSRIKKRSIRHRRVRAKVKGTKTCPRLSVYRSNKHIFLQLIDDGRHNTLFGVSDKAITEKKSKKNITKSDRAYELGKLLADKARELGITKIVFDRGGYRYQGRIKKVAEGAREGNLLF